MYRGHMKRSRLCHSVIWRWVSQTIMYPCSVLGPNQFPCQFRMCATLEMECSLHAMVRLETFLLISVDCMVCLASPWTYTRDFATINQIKLLG